MGYLKSILQAQGITVIENEDDQQSEITRPEELKPLPNGKPRPNERRRLSFDDARLNETWLSQHSTSVHDELPKRLNLLSLRPKRRGSSNTGPRARSNSAQRTPLTAPVPRRFLERSSSVGEFSEIEANLNPTLLFEPSQTQLEQNAEAFLYTSSFRAARKCLSAWHESAMSLQDGRQQHQNIAAARDRKTLLKQAFDEWHAAFDARRQERRIKVHWEHEEQRADVAYFGGLARKVLSHWATACSDQRVATGCAKRYMLKFRYFKRWQSIAIENASKARTIIARKFVALWREKTARRLLQEEQAEALLEEKYLNKYYKLWFWSFCSRRVDGWHENKVMRRAFNHWIDAKEAIDRKRAEAEDYRNNRTMGRCLRLLRERTRQEHHKAGLALAHRNRTATNNSMRTLAARTKLEPLCRTMTLTSQPQSRAESFSHMASAPHPRSPGCRSAAPPCPAIGVDKLERSTSVQSTGAKDRRTTAC